MTAGIHPNVVVIMADNLGWGELGCYGGGALRGAPTPRIDAFAQDGILLQNFNVESDCVPTRSAFMTGRHPIRTGGLQSTSPNLPQGISPSEITLAQQFKNAGYATAMYGKWHLGDRAGRLPHDRGFDHWYGIPRTTDEVFFTDSIGFDPEVATVPTIMEGKAGDPAREGFPFYIKGELHAIKWRDWKLHFYWEPEVNQGHGKLESPYLFNLKIDPKEEHDIMTTNTWVAEPMLWMVHEFNESMTAFPNIAPGADGPPELARQI